VSIHWTLASYLAKEVVVYTALGFLAAAPVVLIPNLFDRADEFLIVGITAADQLELARWVFPMVVSYALPIAFLFGLMLAIGRLDDDLEITAMRSCGVGIATLLLPILLLGVGVSVITAFLMIDFEPRAKRELVALSLRLLSRGSLIEEGSFQSFGKRMIYVRHRVDDHRLEGIMISDRSNNERAFHVFAESGEFSYDDESGILQFTLEHGDLRMEPNPSKAFEEYRISFSEFDYRFTALKLGVGRLRYRMDQLGLDELRDAVRRIESGNYRRDLKYRNPRMYTTQIHRMLSVPLSSALFAFVAVPLGICGFVRSRAWGMLLALSLLSGYYGLFVYVQTLARAGPVPPAIGIWLPNMILLAAGVILIFKARRLR
jgi:lipopolysaccharide export LptBFGC system permease protein LptF